MISCVIGLFEPPCPLRRRIEGFTGHLPIKQVGFFLFIAVALHAEIFVLFSDSLHFTQGEIKIISVEIMQCGDRDYQVKRIIRPWKTVCIAYLEMVANLRFTIGDCVIRYVNAVNISVWDNLEKIVK